jgi:hypothetical protein
MYIIKTVSLCCGDTEVHMGNVEVKVRRFIDAIAEVAD